MMSLQNRSWGCQLGAYESSLVKREHGGGGNWDLWSAHYGRDRACKGTSSQGCEGLSPAGNNCVGEMEAVDMRRATLVNPFLVLKEAGTSTWGERLNGSPAPYTSVNNGALFLRWSWFPPQGFLVAEFITPIPSGCLLAVNSSPLPGFVLQIPLSCTQHLSTPIDTCLRLGHVGLWHGPSVYVSFSSACHRPVAEFSSNGLWIASSVSIDLPIIERASPDVETSLFLQLPTYKVVGSILLSLLFFFSSFFHPTWLSWNLSCPFRCLRSSASVQPVLCENYIICRCIFDTFMGRVTQSPLTHLPSWLIFI